MQWMLEIVLVALLAATLFYSVRLERALGVLKRDRSALEALVGGFNASTSRAEAGIERLRAAVDGAGHQLALRIDAAAALKDDLTLLSQRGERLADQLDSRLRAVRPVLASTSVAAAVVAGPGSLHSGAPQSDASAAPRPRSQAELDLLKALRMAR
jgi:hypothetical protein